MNGHTAQESVAERAVAIARTAAGSIHWLKAEHLGGDGLRAAQVMAALRHGCRCNVDAAAWLRSVASGRTLKSLHATVILRDLEAHGQIGGES